MAEAETEKAKRTVLIPVDGSENASEAFEFYLKQVIQRGDRVVVLHAFELPPLPYSSGPFVFAYYEEWSQMVKETRQAHEVMLRSYEDQLKQVNGEEPGKEPDEKCKKDKKIHYEIIMVVGKPAGEVICQVAKDENVDLIIMGTRGQGVVRRTFMGSVSDYVVHHAHIPVGVIPRQCQS
ncbi:uncharacterized protein LOC110241105 isoform X2 [Exaiptasia diaphana]|uniref:UspA domain-containing protein n=1 Tax=Exaiptasia diaphana TaxID=2652724 RepID=A0A913XD17_EXADI|nr:uncharacterized protein LOC110241105 isoform X2 [Exaiptasia diaphana]KXJ29699.1 Universal stress protein Slr1101 [Exaiptasia diaphana]